MLGGKGEVGAWDGRCDRIIQRGLVAYHETHDAFLRFSLTVRSAVGSSAPCSADSTC